MRGISSDIRYALRTLRRGGISTVMAVLSVAVGVGANAAIFSVGYAMLASPLPYPGADRLVMLRSMNPSHGVFWTTAAPANLLDWQAQAKSFEAIAGYRWRTVDLVGGDRSERLRGLHITPEFFRVLGVLWIGCKTPRQDYRRQHHQSEPRRANAVFRCRHRSGRGAFPAAQRRFQFGCLGHWRCHRFLGSRVSR